MKRKALSALACLLALCLFAGAAAAETVVGGGNCGMGGTDTVTWTLTDPGDGKLVLSISGMGRMADFGPGGAPWYDQHESISSVEIATGVESIGKFAFADCRSLTAVAIPGSVTSIGKSAFQYCSSLTKVTIPGSVTSIGKFAFYSCSSLTEVTIPGSVTSIGESAFWGCGSLTEVAIPGSVRSIKDRTFEKCGGLSAVTIPGSVTSIGSSAFRDCGSLTEVTIPGSVTSIGGSAFQGCGSLAAVTIPGSVRRIESGTFSDCGSLAAVTIPGSVTSIGRNVFSHCGALKRVWYAGTEPEWDAIEKTAGWNSGTPQDMTVYFLAQEIRNGLVLPAGLTAIETGAFAGASSVRAVYIPDKCLTIGAGAFARCGGLLVLRVPNGMGASALESAGLPAILLLTGPAGGAAAQIAASHPGWSFLAE